MDADQVQTLLAGSLTGCDISVEAQGNHFDITVVGEVFAGLRAVKRQQMVYAVLAEPIASGAMHAVNLKLYTPAEWQAK